MTFSKRTLLDILLTTYLFFSEPSKNSKTIFTYIRTCLFVRTWTTITSITPVTTYNRAEQQTVIINEAGLGEWLSPVSPLLQSGRPWRLILQQGLDVVVIHEICSTTAHAHIHKQDSFMSNQAPHYFEYPCQEALITMTDAIL